jgi:hypothetical protein
MILTIKGRGIKEGELPIGMAEARRYFERDLPAFIRKIEDVESVKELGQPGMFLVTDKPIGALNYTVTIVAVLVAEWEEGAMKLSSRDFELDKIKSPHQVVKSFIDGGLKLSDRGPEKTGVALDFTMTVEFPVPGALRLIPQILIQSTSDGIMNIKMGATVQALYRKVLEDFKLPA